MRLLHQESRDALSLSLSLPLSPPLSLSLSLIHVLGTLSLSDTGEGEAFTIHLSATRTRGCRMMDGSLLSRELRSGVKKVSGLSKC